MDNNMKFGQLLLFALIAIIQKEQVCSQELLVKFILVYDIGQEHFLMDIANIFKNKHFSRKHFVDFIAIQMEENENMFDKLCNAFAADGTFIIDISWSGEELIKDISQEFDAPYVRMDLSLSPHLDLLHKYLHARNSTDVALIFNDALHMDQTLFYWFDAIRLRILVTEKLVEVTANTLRELRPIPSAYALIASASNLNTIYNQLNFEKLLKLPERWNLVVLDFQESILRRRYFAYGVNILYLDKAVCCAFLSEESCACSSNEELYSAFINVAFDKLFQLIKDTVHTPQIGKIQCNVTKFDRQVYDTFTSKFSGAFSSNSDIVINNENVLRIRAKGMVEMVEEDGNTQIIAKYYQNNSFEVLDVLRPEFVKAVKPFYRIGITYAIPWTFEEIDPLTGKKVWTGYCIDFTAKLAEIMNFDYELVIPKKGTFGKKDENGHWDGLIGDLARGETDIVIAALIMTADREEVIDFVAPYFEQAGITIVMRKLMSKTSLFKFMTVLELEVWMSIVCALVISGFTIWFLDKYSPYSSRNNKDAYPYPTRQFDLKESFWFALTSFTPHGGGEVPKAFSGRILVAAYWLFVVLMLATFTANLAAFLTVERMQAQVQSLEQLASQARINYTVVENSDTHEYFINMKNAEDTLYRLWKELTLNASTGNSRFRVWDYPFKEQYGQMLLAIDASVPVKNAQEGFDKVNERLDADFAFIHDSAEVKYAIAQNCNLTEIGEVFAERPYAIAIQQGSHLQDLISLGILELQQDRFFESLQAKYWDNSLRAECDSSSEDEGTTVDSLGGVFIATSFGLALAMIALVGEVLYYKMLKKRENRAKEQKISRKVVKVDQQKYGSVTIGKSFKPKIINKDNVQVSHIALYPRLRNHLPVIH